jgi:hypothetical protein
MSVRTLERVAQALGSRVNVRLDWNGEALDRLLDADHARVVESVVRQLRAWGWEVATEVTFAMGGERGSVDVLARHLATATLLVVEVKTVVPDVQGMLAAFDRKVRLGLAIGRQRGWDGRAVGRLLVITDGRTTRRRVLAHAETFDSTVPARTAAVRRWLAEPDPERPLRGLWLFEDRGSVPRHRVRTR